MFKDELEQFERDGILSKYFVTFSRYTDSEDLKYVQHVLKANGKFVVDLMINQQAVLYVCGDAKGMARDVNDALVQLMIEEGSKTKDEALMQLSSWKNDKRYLLDIRT